MDIFDGDLQYTRNEVVPVGITSLQLSYPMKRTVLYIYNASSTSKTEQITIRFGSISAVSGQGVVLMPGQAYIESNSEGFETYSGSINIVCDQATGSVVIMER